MSAVEIKAISPCTHLNPERPNLCFELIQPWFACNYLTHTLKLQGLRRRKWSLWTLHKVFQRVKLKIYWITTRRQTRFILSGLWSYEHHLSCLSIRRRERCESTNWRWHFGPFRFFKGWISATFCSGLCNVSPTCCFGSDFISLLDCLLWN